MLPVYVLSFDSITVVDNTRLHVYKWVKVGSTQVKPGMEVRKTQPVEKPGDVVRYGLEDKGPTTLKVLGNGTLRELTDDEENSDIVKLRVPRI